MTKVCIYARVSTLLQNVESQVKELQKEAKRRGWEVVRKFSEQISGIKTVDERRALSDLFAFIQDEKNRGNQINAVMFWELSRLGRSVPIIWDSIKKLESLGCWIYIHSPSPMSTENPDPTIDMTISMLGAVAQYEKTMINNRIKRGTDRKAEKGSFNGGVFLPMGFKTDKEKKLIINEDEPKIVKDIFRMSKSGMGTKKIAKELDRLNIKTRTNTVSNERLLKEGIKVKRGLTNKPLSAFRWNDGSVYSILTNKLYAGKRIYLGQEYAVPSIIDEVEFNEVGQLLKSRHNRGGKEKHFYILERGKTKCGICGRNYYPITSNNNFFYMCSSKRIINHSCFNYSIGIRNLTDSVWKIIRHSENFKRMVKDQLRIPSLQEKISELRKKIAMNASERGELMEQKKIIDNMRQLRQLTQTEYTPRFNQIQARMIETTDQDNDMEIQIKNLEETIQQQMDLKEQIHTIKGERNLLKEVINKVIQKIVIYPVLKTKLELDNKKDKMLYIELFTIYGEKPVCYLITQRTKIIYYTHSRAYNHKNYSFDSTQIQRKTNIEFNLYDV
jgi:site-specific DNA recombinase